MTTIQAAHQFPAAHAALVSALQDGDLDAAAAAVPDGALSGLPGGGHEKAARTIARDRRALRRALKVAFAGRRLEVLVHVADGADRHLVEGRLVDRRGVPVQSLLASFALSGAEVERQLVFTCPPLTGAATWSAPATHGRPADAREVIDRYFAHLDASEFELAADCFSADVFYSHPPYGPGLPRAEFRGREELLAGFRRARGPRPDREHHILLSPQRGAECLLEGFTVDRPVGCSFISSLSLDGDGRIRRYVAVMCEPAVR
jgi:hypothetical protein